MTARPPASTSSPQTRETPSRRSVSQRSTRSAVAACRRTIARPRGSTGSPQTRETRPGRPLLGSSTRAAVAAYRRTTVRRLYKLAADQGNAVAQAYLGIFYEQGRGGLPKDDREAARPFKLAADQGNAYAEAGLRRLAP